MSRPAAPKKGVAMCCVTIGFDDYLLPAAQGMKLVEIMASAFSVDKQYGGAGRYNYFVGEQPNVELTLVKPAQIKQKPAEGDQLLIGMD